ncbi:unnamed protein product [Aureobasidium vineae]|uniref:Uncharacterized protein n=1 Tax=Aureobasidium vineae TaxID=2773715 RepID=A0A9N8P6L5_9PEZI|nr:unnamed protein product [Aureobasidium vineae]
MYISVSRIRPYVGSKWNAHISVPILSDNININCISITSLEFGVVVEWLGEDLGIDFTVGPNRKDDVGDDWCLVWRSLESGNLGRVYDDTSLQAAVQDYRRAHRHVVDLFVIKGKGKCLFYSEDEHAKLTHLHRRY